MVEETIVFDGSAIKQARQEANISQQEVAKCVGLSRQAISKFENNECEPTATPLLRIMRLLRIAPQRLEGGRENNSSQDATNG